MKVLPISPVGPVTATVSASSFTRQTYDSATECPLDPGAPDTSAVLEK